MLIIYNVILHIDHGNNKWWQKEKGAKCHQKKKEKFKVKPKKYVTNFMHIFLCVIFDADNT